MYKVNYATRGGFGFLNDRVYCIQIDYKLHSDCSMGSGLLYHLTATVQNGSTAYFLNFVYWKSDNLLYWSISHAHLTYEQMQQVKLKQVFNTYIEGFCMWNVFWYKLVIFKYRPSCLNESWSLRQVYFYWLNC